MTEITHELFTEHLNQMFRIVAPDRPPLELELTEIEVIDPGVELKGMRQPFTLIFTGSRDDVLPEGTYAAEHGELSVSLYFIPITTLGARQDYQVVFN